MDTVATSSSAIVTVAVLLTTLTVMSVLSVPVKVRITVSLSSKID